MAETPNPINDAPPSSTDEVGHADVEEALLKKFPLESKGSWREIRRNLKISLSFIKFERQYRPNAETFIKFETPYRTKA